MATSLYDGGEFIVPWRNVSTRQEDGTVVYYTASPKNGCNPCISASSTHLIRNVLSSNDDLTKPPGESLIGHKVLLVANPSSGTGKAKSSDAVEILQDVLGEAGLETTVHYTERPLHAVEIIVGYGSNLSQFKAVCAIGGDGTLHEVINGMGQVASVGVPWEQIPPLAVVPTGSGNAIANSTGIVSTHHAALNVIHSLRTQNAKPLAAMRFSPLVSPKPSKLSVGGLQWGLLADADQGTEHLRWMGDLRFDLGAVMSIAKNKFNRSRVRITVDPVQHEAVTKMIQAGRKEPSKEEQPISVLEDVGDNTFILDTVLVLCLAWNSSLISEGVKITPYAKVTELGMFDFVAIRADISRMEMIKLFLNVEDGSLLTMSEAVYYFKATKVVFESIEGRFLTIDGESVPVEPCVIEMSAEDGKLRILDSFSEETESEP